MEAPGLQETVQLASVFSSFLGEMMKTGVEGAGLLFRGTAGIVKGSYALIMLAKREHEQNQRDPSNFRRGSYTMADMIKVCSKKNVNMQLMRIRNDSRTIEEFEKYARENKLAYSIMPDLNMHDEYIEVMYPSTQAVQYQSFINNINKKQAFNISMDDYINNATPDKQQEMQTIIDNLSEEEKRLVNNSVKRVEDGNLADAELLNVPDTYDTKINISGQQLIKKNEDGLAVIALTDDNNMECYLKVPESAITQEEFGFKVKLNGTEQLEYPDAADIILNNNDILRETNAAYIVSLPNTNGEAFIALDKRNCKLSGSKITVPISPSERYPLLNKNYQFSGELTGKEVYRGHFDSRLTSADTIERYNVNYQNLNRLNVPQPLKTKADKKTITQPKNKMDNPAQMPGHIVVEVDQRCIEQYFVGKQRKVTTSQGIVKIDQSCFLDSRDQNGNQRTFIRLNAGDTFIMQDNKNGNREYRISGADFASIVRNDRLRSYTFREHVQTKKKTNNITEKKEIIRIDKRR